MKKELGGSWTVLFAEVEGPFRHLIEKPNPITVLLFFIQNMAMR